MPSKLFSASGFFLLKIASFRTFTNVSRNTLPNNITNSISFPFLFFSFYFFVILKLNTSFVPTKSNTFIFRMSQLKFYSPFNALTQPNYSLTQVHGHRTQRRPFTNDANSSQTYMQGISLDILASL